VDREGIPEHRAGGTRGRSGSAVFDEGTHAQVAPEDYIWEACRLAVAHASLKSPSDADDAAEIRRLSVAAFVLRLLARRFIMERYKISESPVSDVADMSDTSSDGNRH
jgi:hypothetical protein